MGLKYKRKTKIPDGLIEFPILADMLLILTHTETMFPYP